MTLRPRLRAALRRFGSSDRAVAIIETALVLPLILLVGLGGLEMSNLGIAHMRVGQMASKLADNASRISADTGLPLPQVREADVNEILAATLAQGNSIALKQNGYVILSSLEVDSTSGNQLIHWQRCTGDKPEKSRYGSQGKTGSGFGGMGQPGKVVSAPPGQAVMYVELIYAYQPLILSSLKGRVIRSDASFLVRDSRDLSGITNPAPATKISTCL